MRREFLMPDIKTSRPFRERFLNGFDRSQLREEVQAVKPQRLRGMRKKYATWALGASLALGGIGAPMKIFVDHAASKHVSDESPTPAPAAPTEAPKPAADQGIASDLKAAQNIATQVAGGVQALTTGVAQAAIH